MENNKTLYKSFTKLAIKVALAKGYQRAGIYDLTLKMYEGGRHEMLNEINKEEVESDFINWLNKRIESKN